ncbi:MAG: CBS domain-containing protein [Thermodesulfovibrionales bacterium]|nr:CBS domain-containing protein [Thermodesulfovibrionales bacterium]
MKVRDIMAVKGGEVVAVSKDETVATAITTMYNKKISSVLVIDENRPVGIFTERDVVECWIKTGKKPFDELFVRDYMTTDLIVAEMDDDINEIMNVLIDKNIRHLPVVEKGKIVGMLSIRDVLKTMIKKMEVDIHYLKDYIKGGFIPEVC